MNGAILMATDVLDRGEPPPERHRQHEPADRGLQVEADQWDFARDAFGVRDQLVLAGARHGGEREQPGVIAEAARRLCLAHRLRGAPGEPGDHDRRRGRPLGGAAHRQLQHRPVEPGVADRELGGVDADREPAGAGVEVVAGQRALAAGVELALGIERERMRRDHDAPAQRRQHLRGPVLPAQSHRGSSSNQTVTYSSRQLRCQRRITPGSRSGSRRRCAACRLRQAASAPSSRPKIADSVQLFDR